jgi:hypothetical protein
MPNFVRNLQNIALNHWGNPQHGPRPVKNGPALLDPSKKPRGPTLQYVLLYQLPITYTYVPEKPWWRNVWERIYNFNDRYFVMQKWNSHMNYSQAFKGTN